MRRKTFEPFSVFKFVLNTLVILTYFVFANLIYAKHPKLAVAGIMFLGAYYFIIIMQFIFLRRRHSMTGAYILFYSGCLLLLISLLNIGNRGLVLLSSLLTSWNINFHFENLFTDIYAFVFSLPALISGIIMIIAGILWDRRNTLYIALSLALFASR